MVVLIATSCAGGPGTGGKSAARISLAGQMAGCKRQALLECSPRVPAVAGGVAC